MSRLQQPLSLEASLLESALDLLKKPDQKGFLDGLVEQAGRLLNVPNAFVYLLEADRLYLTVGSGVHEPFVGYRLGLGEGLAGRVWQTGKSLWVNDYDVWPFRAEQFPLGQIHACIAIPIKLEGEVRAVLGVSSREAQRHFGKRDAQTLEGLAETTAVAFKHHCLNQELSLQRDLTENLLINLSESVVQMDDRWTIHYASGNWNNLIGNPEASSVDRNFLDFVHPEDREPLLRTASEQTQHSNRYSLDLRLRSLQGEVVWVSTHVQVTCDAQGQMVAATAVVADISQRKRNEAALEQSKVRKDQLLQSLAEAVIETDLQGIVSYVNPAWTQMTGFSFEATLGKPYLDFVVAEDGDLVREVVRRANLGNPESIRAEYRLRTKKGRFCWVNSQGSWLRDLDGEIVGISGVLTNIHDRKQAEETLLESRERYRNLVESVDGVIWESNRRGKLFFISPRVQQLLGYTIREWLRTPGIWQSHLHPEDKDRVMRERHEAVSKRQDYQVEYRYIHPSGRILWLRDVCRILVEPGKATRLLGLTIDITAQKQIELELAQSEARYALAARGSNDGIWDWDLQSGVIHISARFSEILGYEPLDRTETSGWEHFERLVHPEDLERVTLALQAHIEGDAQGVSVDFRMQHAEGHWRWVNLRGVASFSEPGSAIRMAGSLSDISERGNYYDKLTNLPGRSLFNDRLERAIRKGQRQANNCFAVLFLDLDRFKVVNDSLGHLVGDLMLIEVARRLETCLRPGDTVARLGGDEFVVLLEQLVDVGDARIVSERIREALARPFKLRGHETFTEASIGIVSNTTRYESVDDYLRAADTAMYQAKGSGSGVAEYDEQMHTQATLRLETESSLRKAIEADELILMYQPIISLGDGMLQGFEALVRWTHPRRGMLAPAEFIPIAEEMGLIVQLGSWVIYRACHQLLTLSQLGQDRLYISVNVSGRQLQQANFHQEVAAIIHHFQLQPDRLHLEITENAVVEAADVVLENIEHLRLLGVRFHLDDFGTGYSSLSNLRKLPIDLLKIDRSFISQEATSNRLIVEAVVQMADALGLKVVCEGIETREQAAWLKGLECSYGQGFLFSRPLPAESIEGLVQNQIKIYR